MSDWRKTVLSEVIDLQRGHDLPTPERRLGGVPILGSFGITGWHDSAKYQGPGVTIGRSGASFGTAAYTDLPYWPLNTALFVSNFKGNHPRWVYWLLHSIDFSGFNSGSAQPSLNRNFLKQIPVSLPPLEDQRRIAEILGALDDLIEVDLRLAVECSKLAQILWEELTAGHSPSQRLSARASIVLGGTPARNRAEYWSGEIPWLNSGKANDFRVTQASQYITQLGLEKSSTKLMPTGSTILAITGATLGQVSRMEISACGNQSLVGIYAEDMAVNDHLYFATQDQIDVLVRSATGGAQQHINKANVEELLVKWPSDEEIRAWHSVAEPLMTATADLLREADEAAKVRDELLPLLMSGAVSVMPKQVAA